ncbi:MAG: glycosyltransferase family 39 protein [Nanoarchaeota archaeon]|nr:glycosyltransferase family 39 protein [Nanoarchaeota archaeon]
MEGTINQSKEKILNFFTNNFNLILIAILIFSFYLRLKYFNVNTAVWWDESEYLVTAKHWALGVPYEIASQRQPLFPLLISIFYFLGFHSEAIIRFFVVLLPSFFSVYLTYLLGKELYDKYTGLIAAYIMGIFWVLLFNTARVHTDPIAFVFGLAAFYFFWKGYVKKQKETLNLILTGLFLGLGFLIRVGGVLPIVIIISYLLITENIKIFKKKKLYLTAIVSTITVSPYLIWNYFHFGNLLAFWDLYFGARKAAIKFSSPIAWHLMDYFQQYTGTIFFILFLIGLTYLIRVFLGFDLIFKNKDKSLKSDFFITLSILVPMIFFIFIERQAEPRWVIIMAPAIFYIIAKGCKTIYNLISKYDNLIAIAVITILLIAGSVYQLKLNNDLINQKKDSYFQFRDAGLWIKENSNTGDLIYSNGLPQVNYYSERYTWSMGGGSPEKFEEVLGGMYNKTRYMILSLLEIEPQWMSQETFLQNGLDWKLPYFEAELLVQNNQAQATFKGQPVDYFPPPEIIKNDLKFNLVYSIEGLFIYEITYL